MQQWSALLSCNIGDMISYMRSENRRRLRRQAQRMMLPYESSWDDGTPKNAYSGTHHVHTHTIAWRLRGGNVRKLACTLDCVSFCVRLYCVVGEHSSGDCVLLSLCARLVSATECRASPRVCVLGGQRAWIYLTYWYPRSSASPSNARRLDREIGSAFRRIDLGLTHNMCMGLLQF